MMQVSAKTELPWYRDGLRFECQNCGYCCTGEPGYVWITEADIARIARYCGVSADEFRERAVERARGKLTLREFPNGDCTMYKRGEGCTIYPVRPPQCRTYPFWPDIVKSPRRWRKEAKNCPGIGYGKLYSKKEIRKRLAVRWK